MVHLPNDRQVFFQEALLDIYQTKNNLFGFVYYRNRGFWAIFNGEPIYLSPEIALRYAKLYAIKSSVVEDTETIKIALDFKSDEVLHQSRLVKKTFGKIQGYGVLQLYPNPSDRVDIRNKLEKEGKTRNRVLLQSLDGKQLYGIIDAELIRIDAETVLSVEIFTPDRVMVKS